MRLEDLFLDASHLQAAPGAPAEPVLAAWGIDGDGKPVFVGLAPASSESTDAWDDFLADLKQRGHRDPLLGISDGAAVHRRLRPGVPGQPAPAVPGPSRPQCARKVSVHDQPRVKADLLGHLRRRRRRARRRRRRCRPPPGGRVRDEVEQPLPSAVACVTGDLASLTVHLRFPAEHWRHIRHSNLIEPTFGETRRRTKVIGRLPGGRSLPVAGVGGA